MELNPIPLTQFGDRTLVKRDLPFALSDQEKPVVVTRGMPFNCSSLPHLPVESTI